MESAQKSIFDLAKLLETDGGDVTQTLGLHHLNDDDVVLQMEKVVKAERGLSTVVLHYFAEVESRRLFAKLGFSSLFAMAVEHFKYSAAAAERRIAASRLIRQLPEVEQKIADGVLNLTTAAKAHAFFEAERRVCAKSISWPKSVKS